MRVLNRPSMKIPVTATMQVTRETATQEFGEMLAPNIGALTISIK